MWKSLQGYSNSSFAGLRWVTGLCWLLLNHSKNLIHSRLNLIQSLWGITCAGSLIAGQHFVIGQFGVSQPVITAILISGFIALTAGIVSARLFQLISPKRKLILSRILLVSVAGWLTLFPLLNTSILSLFESLDSSYFTNPVQTTLILLIPSAACFALPLCLLTVEFCLLPRNTQLQRLLWIGLSLCLLPVTLIPMIGIGNLLIAILINWCIITLYDFSTGTFTNNTPAQLPAQVTSKTTSTTVTKTWSFTSSLLLAGLIGIMTAGIRYFSNLVIASEFLPLFEIGTILSGCAWGLYYSQQKQGVSSLLTNFLGLTALLGAGISGLALLAFPQLVHWILWTTTYVELLPLIIISKLLPVALFYLPLGFATGICLSEIYPESTSTSSTLKIRSIILSLLMVSLSCWITRYWMIPQLGVAKTCLFWSAWLVLIGSQDIGRLISACWYHAWKKSPSSHKPDFHKLNPA